MKAIARKTVFFIFNLLKGTRLLAENLRAPRHFFLGYIAKKAMLYSNQGMIEESVRRLNIKESDFVLEIGAGNGQALSEILKKKPKGILAVEVSPIFQKKLERKFREKVTVLKQDAKNLKGVVNDNAIDKLLLVNVVYFLDPLEEYLKELHRILKADGVLFIAGSFEIVKTFDEAIFKNSELNVLLPQLAKYFSVTCEQVPLSQGYPEYTALTLKKRVAVQA